MVERSAALDVDLAAVEVDEYTLALGDVWRAFAANTVVEVALTDRGRDQLEIEVRGRRWAAGLGIDTPAVRDAGADWLVSERRTTGPQAGSAFVAAVLETTDRLAAAAVPAFVDAARYEWRAPARGRLARVARLARGGMDMVEFVRTRRAAAALDRVQTAHGDFHPGNLLFDDGTGRLAVVDWAQLGPAPLHTDLVRLWGQVRSETDSAALADAVLHRTAPGERPAVGTLWHWLALRQRAEHLAAPGTTSDDPGYPAMLARKLEQSRAIARELGGQ